MSRPRRLAVLTTGRQDWGLLRPMCAVLAEDPQFEIEVLAGGMAVDPAFGNIVDRIRAQGFAVCRELRWDVRQAEAWTQCAAAVEGVGEALRDLAPEALVLLGDRFETAAAALAATVAKVPIVHLYGGEETTGIIDNALRHAITKLSHLHLVAHQTYAKRVLQMGEEASSVHVVGGLGVENVLKLPSVSRERLEERLGLALVDPVGLVTVHPTTLSKTGEDAVVGSVIAAVEQVKATWVVTLPNADPGNMAIRARLLELAERNDHVVAVEALGAEFYVGVMRVSQVVLGNSSSGMIEAPAVGVLTVNVGERQAGRLRLPSIVDVSEDDEAVVEAVRRAFDSACRSQLKPDFSLGDGHVSQRILDILRSWVPPRQKMFKEIIPLSFPRSG